jgi:hypothetical protein
MSLDDNKVRLQTGDGGVIIASLDKLSQADRDWIEAQSE